MCSARCGGGTQSRPKVVVQQASGSGQACPVEGSAAYTETRACNEQECTDRIEDHFHSLDDCSHVMCKFHETHLTKTTASKSVKVLHHHLEENGSRHVCRSFPIEGQETRNCVCKCFEPGQDTLDDILAREAAVGAQL